MSTIVKANQNQEVKTHADIEARNKSKAAARGSDTDQKVEELLKDPERLEEFQNNWKKKLGQSGHVSVQSVFDDNKPFPPASSKIQELMRQIKGEQQ